jgi:orotate phosphoribosyltransferase
MIRNEQGWFDEYAKRGALWLHDGNPKRPHALLTSGKHSNGFFNSELVLENPFLLDEASYDLVAALRGQGIDLEDIDRVVGPAMGAITLAHDVALHVTLETPSRHCLRAYTEKETGGDSKLMVFKKTMIRSGERILAVEDVITTGDSVEMTATAVTNVGGIVLPFVAVLVNRSGVKEMNSRKIVALIDRSMPTWDAEGCPLCKEGSEAIRPKGTENWARLNAVTKT